MLGFSSGLPFFLTGNTLGYWMRDEGTALSAIGFLSWVGLAYSIKFLWAPIVDRVDSVNHDGDNISGWHRSKACVHGEGELIFCSFGTERFLTQR